MERERGTAWPSLRTDVLGETITREDESAYLERHHIERAERLGLKDAVIDALLAPLTRWGLVAHVLGWSRGKRGWRRAVLFVPSVVIALALTAVGLAAAFLLVVLAFAFAVLALLDVGFMLVAGTEGVVGEGWLVTLPIVLVGAGLLLGGVWRPVRRQRREVRRGVAFERLAGANGMQYSARFRSSRGDSRPETLSGSLHRVRRRGAGPFEAGVIGGDLEGTGVGNARARWGFAALRLPTGLPHILLDARGSNGLLSSSLPGISEPHGSQRLGLEGGFDRHFTLYCPEGYETDALYLFSPDVMEHLIDRVARYDVEIVDDWLVVYSKRRLGTTEPDDWKAMNETLGALATRIESWGRWRDERHVDAERRASGRALPTPQRGAAGGGRRLRFAPSATAVFGIIVAVVLIGIGAWGIWGMAMEFFRDVGQLFSWIGSLF
ncbi:hypothetical protein [Microbacterium sp. G2-8]|uniref:hypothetical protein n=1 Tax=Microbacterium sp. G2-8 TaxID=2842454 RepID=UPI001C896890|nr:hypothetical protein [Microbacterium sp. G2-8]